MANGQAGESTPVTGNNGPPLGPPVRSKKKVDTNGIAHASKAIATDKAARDLAPALGDLILKLNPYTNTQNKETKRSTGEMNVNMESMEMEGPYAQEWTFKGQPQRVGMAARIKYKYPVRNEKSEVLFWVEDYILIGFQGSMGG